MTQHARRRRVNVTEEQNCLQVQTFYAARTFLYPVVEEHNCSKMENICLKCGGLYFGAEKNTRGAYTHCCHNGKIIEKASTYPVEMKGLMDGSHNLSQHFKKTIRSYNSVLSFVSMGTQIEPPAVCVCVCGRGVYCFRIHGQIYHRTSHLHPDQAGEEKVAQLYVLDSELATCRRMEHCENSECYPELMRSIDEVIRRVNAFAAAYTMMWELEQQVLHEEGHEASGNVTMYIIMRDMILTSTEE
ncbi:ATP-dependent DNA helicase [Trichonephila clavipes]|nr:ATP-dependent DNA helicase [Trichonephila clavipes]